MKQRKSWLCNPRTYNHSWECFESWLYLAVIISGALFSWVMVFYIKFLVSEGEFGLAHISLIRFYVFVGVFMACALIAELDYFGVLDLLLGGNKYV